LIFVTYSLGIAVWARANYAFIMFKISVGISLILIVTTISLICLFMFLVLLPFVSNIAVNSSKLNTVFGIILGSIKLERGTLERCNLQRFQRQCLVLRVEISAIFLVCLLTSL